VCKPPDTTASNVFEICAVVVKQLVVFLQSPRQVVGVVVGETQPTFSLLMLATAFGLLG
jgi:hypothetical protein